MACLGAGESCALGLDVQVAFCAPIGELMVISHLPSMAMPLSIG